MTEHEINLLSGLPGWCSPRKMQDIYRAVASLSLQGPVYGVEIGVLGGRSLLPAALAIRDNDPCGHITGIDPYGIEYFLDGAGARPPNDPPWPGTNDLSECRHIALNYCRRVGLQWVSLLIAPARDVASLFGEIRYLHIDGNHTSDVSLGDVTTWLPKVRKGGIVILDDVDFESMQPAREYLTRHCTRSLYRVTRAEDANEYEVFEK